MFKEARRSGGARWAACFLICAALSFFPAGASGAGKGSMEIGLAGRYEAPAMDVDVLDPGFGYGLIYHYWLNDTTTVLVGFSHTSFKAGLKLPTGDEDFYYTTSVLYGGARYRFPLDLAIKPYLEGGLGYHLWTTEGVPSEIDDRDGATITYFAGVGLEYDLLHTFTVGLNCRYLYMPMSERIETEAYQTAGGRWEVTEHDIENAGYFTTGIEFTWIFR